MREGEEDEGLGIEGELTEEEKLIFSQDNNPKISIGAGTLVLTRLLFGKFK